MNKSGKMSKSDLTGTRVEEAQWAAEREARRVEKPCLHFKPGTGVVMQNRTYAVVSVQGPAMLITDGTDSFWVRPQALAWQA